ncbi:MAG: PTS IIA-like nitrogen regulatory protein PtsN [Geminicoccaceae bacterium]
MIELSDLLPPGSVVLGLKAGSKRQVLRLLAERVAADEGLDPGKVLDALLEREKLGTTGIGDGLAIPHAKLDGLDRLVGVFARLEHPVDFEALDDEPVDLLFLLLAPTGAAADHLKALARVARVFRDEALCRALREVEEPGRAFELLTGRQRPQAA